MIFKIKKSAKYYEECMYIESNYYVFKKKPKTKVHSLLNVYLFAFWLILGMMIGCFFVSFLRIISIVFWPLLVVYGYLFFETRYKLKEYLKGTETIVKIDDTGIESTKDNAYSLKLSWDAVEKVIINKNTICFLPNNFAHMAIFCNSEYKDEVLKWLKKAKKVDLLSD